MEVSEADLASFDEKASAWKTDAGIYEFQICSSANDVEAVVTGKVKAWKAAAHNAVKPQVKLNLLKR
jgi:beta-glucosidase